MEALLLFLGGFVGFILLMMYGSAVSGLILYKFWYWFILPVFITAPHINFWQAMGLSMFLIIFKSISAKERYIGKQEIKEKTNWGTAIITPWFMLLIGWLLHLWIS